MVTASITFSVITIVISFIIGIVGAFPMSDGTVAANHMSGDATDGDTTKGIERVSEGLLLSYTDIINDIASFQKDPDLERAEARKEAFTQFAQELVDQCEGFSARMQGMMDDLTF